MDEIGRRAVRSGVLDGDQASAAIGPRHGNDRVAAFTNDVVRRTKAQDAGQGMRINDGQGRSGAPEGSPAGNIFAAEEINIGTGGVAELEVQRPVARFISVVEDGDEDVVLEVIDRKAGIHGWP